jgi:hypothetical protein
MNCAGGVGPAMRVAMPMAVEETWGVCTMRPAKGNLVQLRADETWYASESWTLPAQRMMLFAGSRMKAMRSGERSVSRTKEVVSSCSGEIRMTRRNWRFFFARSKACA